MTGTALAARRAAARVLQARGVADPAEHAQHPRGRARPRLHHRRGQGRRRSSSTSPRCTRPGSRSWSAPATSPSPRSCTSGWSRPACPRSCSTPRTTPRRRAIIAEAGKLRLGHGLHPDGRPRHRHPAGRLRRGRPRRGRRARRPARHRHRPAPHRRLDNQLRGRAGRQGDPGSSVFFSSWEDDVVVAHLEPEKLQQAADRNRRRRPHRQQEGGRPARPRAAGRRGPAARRCTPTPGSSTS